MAEQVFVDPGAVAADEAGAGILEVTPDVAYLRLPFVNVVLVGRPGERDRVLVDAGIPGAAGRIGDAAANRFGVDVPPRAIVLTHGHFDHVGSLETFAERWSVPVYAHGLERPYLDGSASYPRSDPAVGSGMMVLPSPPYPRGSGECRGIAADGGDHPLKAPPPVARSSASRIADRGTSYALDRERNLCTRFHASALTRSPSSRLSTRADRRRGRRERDRPGAWVRS